MKSLRVKLLLWVGFVYLRFEFGTGCVILSGAVGC